MTAPISTSQPEFRRRRNKTNSETTAITIVTGSTSDARPSCHVTSAISASDPTFAPSRKAPAILDLRIRGTNGPLAATKKKRRYEDPDCGNKCSTHTSK
jgi:hypothetical protein